MTYTPKGRINISELITPHLSGVSKQKKRLTKTHPRVFLNSSKNCQMRFSTRKNEYENNYWDANTLKLVKRQQGLRRYQLNFHTKSCNYSKYYNRTEGEFTVWVFEPPMLQEQ
mmetsp:Transcript_12106/g.13376  ORF Transcript_12106/g.13376 Transcript_12106/m.13376 type:complete len:113 (+) Transcript_12106:163-501(+)